MKSRKTQEANGWLPRATGSAALTLLIILQLLGSSSAQFLFTYEINPESDDNRVPKSSLFDPSSFKIVTPSQLQSSYQKLSSQLDAAVSAGSLPPPPAVTERTSAGELAGSTLASPAALQAVDMNDSGAQAGAAEVAPQTEAGDQSSTPRSSSLLKQTSAALQSFAEIFNLSGGPSSPASPLGLLASAPTLASGGAASGSVNQEAEARSLHEHWTQQQQRAHQQQAALATPALNSFTTSQPVSQPPQPSQQQPAQASYWLTANPLSGPDGSYLVQIKQQQQQQKPSIEQPASPTPLSIEQLPPANQPQLLDNLLAVGQRAQRAINQPPKQPASLAQNSFLATPTSYYPGPSSSASSLESPHRPGGVAGRQQPQENFLQPLANQARDLSSFTHTTAASLLPGPASFQPAPQQQLQARPLEPVELPQQLRPPANLPENFQLPASKPAQVHKSAEETLLLFRQQQHRNNPFPAPEHFKHPAGGEQEPPAEFHANDIGQNGQLGHKNARQVLHQPQHSPASTHSHAPEQVPKVSPQIYESFLLQQKDQHEKHMELLKQHQELNRLMEQKQRQQQEAELRKKQQQKKREEQEMALAKKRASREREELARKAARQEQEELETRRKRDEEARRRAAAEEQRRLQEAREREAKRRQEQEALEAAERKRAAEELELQVESKRRKEREEQEAAAAKLASFARQQEELRKLLELKQREEEAQQQQRRRQAAAGSGTRSAGSNQASRARSLAQEHRDRAGSAVWGAPIRSRLPSPLAETALAGSSQSSLAASSTTEPTSSLPATSSSPPPQQVSTTVSSEKQTRHRNRPIKKQRTSGEEKLIRQKIPLYSGAGKYGLYRGGNDSALANDLAALLDSVSLPSSNASSTTTSTPAPPAEFTTSRHFAEMVTSSLSLVEAGASSSLSPLLDRSLTSGAATRDALSFDDDVPRRPPRGLSAAKLASQRQASQAGSPGPSRPAANASDASQGPPSARRAHIGLASLPADADNDGIPGRAGVEYPVLSQVPATSFSCSKQPLNGYYADTETACQVVHLCQGGVQSSILCPNGTIFNQEKFSCQWWYEVNCSRAPIFYQLNDNLYKALPAAGPSSASEQTDSTDRSKRKLRKERNQANMLSAASA